MANSQQKTPSQDVSPDFVTPPGTTPTLSRPSLGPSNSLGGLPLFSDPSPALIALNARLDTLENLLTTVTAYQAREVRSIHHPQSLARLEPEGAKDVQSTAHTRERRERSPSRPLERDHDRAHARPRQSPPRRHASPDSRPPPRRERRRARRSRTPPREAGDHSHPLSLRIQRYTASRHVKVPSEVYDGKGDPRAHVNRVKDMIRYHTKDEEALCQTFALTLTGAARDWFYELPPNSIDSFERLERAFKARFATSIPLKKSSASLLDLQRKPEETLRAYVDRFNQEVSLTPRVSIEIAVEAVKRNCRFEKLEDSLLVDPIETLDELRLKMSKFVKMEENKHRRERDVSLARYDSPTAIEERHPHTRETTSLRSFSRSSRSSSPTARSTSRATSRSTSRSSSPTSSFNFSINAF